MVRFMISTIGIGRWIRRLAYGYPLRKLIKRGLKVGKKFSMLEEVVLDFPVRFILKLVMMSQRLQDACPRASCKHKKKLRLYSNSTSKYWTPCLHWCKCYYIAGSSHWG